MLRLIWKAGCLETCTSGLGLGPGGSSPAYTTLRALPKLQCLDLQTSQVTDAGLEHLKGFTTLVDLYLAETQVTDAG